MMDIFLTFFAMKSTTISARMKQPAAILAEIIFVEASIRAIPQKDEPRSENKRNPRCDFPQKILSLSLCL